MKHPDSKIKSQTDSVRHSKIAGISRTNHCLSRRSEIIFLAFSIELLPFSVHKGAYFRVSMFGIDNDRVAVTLALNRNDSIVCYYCKNFLNLVNSAVSSRCATDK